VSAYEDFLARKAATAPACGVPVEWLDDHPIGEYLFLFQRALALWALLRGKAAIFAAVGLGKTRMQLEFARLASLYLEELGETSDVLLLTPLAVASQTVREAERIGISAHYVKGAEQMVPGRITVTNYDRAHNFNPERFGVVVLDESSIIKHHDSKTRDALIKAYKRTPFKLACTATPAPNDRQELGNHAEFLDVMTLQEMLSEFFVHDSGSGTDKWRLKGHAESHFWRWVASWGAMVQRPSDLGFSDDGYDLPPAVIHEHRISATEVQDRAILDATRKVGVAQQLNLIPQPARGLKAQRKARRVTLEERVSVAAAIVAEEPWESWAIWCELNDESEALQHAISQAIPGCVEIRGSDTPGTKETNVLGFAEGRVPAIVTKASIAGFGVNWQSCHNTILVGPTHSFEDYHQIIGRFRRFGQQHPVNVHIVYSELEGDVRSNLLRKQAEFAAMAESMRGHVGSYVLESVLGGNRHTTPYHPSVHMAMGEWLVQHAEET
jgi:superfamily II DNA or RNA helicase